MGHKDRVAQQSPSEQASNPEVNPLSLLQVTVVGTAHAGSISSTVKKAIADADVLIVEGSRLNLGNGDVLTNAARGKAIPSEVELTNYRRQRGNNGLYAQEAQWLHSILVAVNGTRKTIIHADNQAEAGGKHGGLIEEVTAFFGTTRQKIIDMHNAHIDPDEIVKYFEVALFKASAEQIAREDAIAKVFSQNFGAIKVLHRNRKSEDKAKPIKVAFIFGRNHQEGLVAALQAKLGALGDIGHDIPVSGVSDNSSRVEALTNRVISVCFMSMSKDIRAGQVYITTNDQGKDEVIGFDKEYGVRAVFETVLDTSISSVEAVLMAPIINDLSTEDMLGILKADDFSRALEEKIMQIMLSDSRAQESPIFDYSTDKPQVWVDAPVKKPPWLNLRRWLRQEE